MQANGKPVPDLCSFISRILGKKPMLDVLIITALKDEYDAVLHEYNAVLQVPPSYAGGRWLKEQGPDGREVAVACFTSSNGHALHIGVTYPFDMGVLATAILAEKYIPRYQPQCLAMCGVMAGREGKVHRGDVVIADRLFLYDNGKIIATYDEEGRRFTQEERNILTYNLDTVWMQKAEQFTVDLNSPWLKTRPREYYEQELWLLKCLLNKQDPREDPLCIENCPDWEIILHRLWGRGDLEKDTLQLTEPGRKRIEKELLLGKEEIRNHPPFKVHVGPIATGSHVVEDENIFKDLAESVRKVLGIDMEAAAIGSVHHASAGQIQKFIVMKGVQDFANKSKDDHFRIFAARASAECLISFLCKNMEPRSPLAGLEGILKPGNMELGAQTRTPSVLLNQMYEVVPFYEKGREEILNEIAQWLDTEEPVRARLFFGQGGWGKRGSCHISAHCDAKKDGQQAF